MKKIVLTFGLIAGLICGASFFIFSPSDGEIDFENGHLYGYITMTIALSTIFFAVKQYRDNHSNGTIKFGKAFLIGLYVTLVAGVIYVLAWEIYYTNYAQDFMDQYVEWTKDQMVEQGKSQAEIDATLVPQIEMMETYKNNILVRMGITFLEIFPVGLLMSLISALVFGVFMKKKEQPIVT